MEVCESAFVQKMRQSTVLVLSQSLVCIEGDKHFMAVGLQVIDKYYKVGDKLFPNVWFLYALREQKGMLLIKEAKAAGGLLAWTAISCDNCKALATFSQIA